MRSEKQRRTIWSVEHSPPRPPLSLSLSLFLSLSLSVSLSLTHSHIGMDTETRYFIGLGAKLWKTGELISSDVNGSVIGTGEVKKTHIHLLYIYKFYPARVTSCFYMQ